MVLFLMALKSKAVSRDWTRVSRLCEAALLSAYRQTDPDFRILLICHEKPLLQHEFDHRLEIIQVDFSPPDLHTTETMGDKWRKITLGLTRAAVFKPQFVMIMDADDLISNRIVAHAHAHPDSSGWILKKGWIYRLGRRFIDIWDDYNCGTNAIVNSRHIQFPKDLTTEEFNRCILLTSGHTNIEKSMATAGNPLEPLPFRGGVYVVEHGDNESILAEGRWQTPWRSTMSTINRIKGLIKHLPKKRWVGRKSRSEFPFDELNQA